MYDNYLCLEKLEFHKITEMVSHFCCTYKAKELASGLVPSHKTSVVKRLLQETRRSC